MDMDEQLLFKKAYGCLAGVACGDAMGMPTSMMSPQSIHKAFPGGIDAFQLPPAGHPIHGGFVAGQVTDDTMQTLVVADAILGDGKVIPRNLALRLLEWAESLNGFESLLLGPSSLRALRAIKEGKDITRTGAFGDTNGACMRISPIGIIHPGEIRETVDDVALACLPTHNTDIAIAGASAVACAIAAGINNAGTVDDVILAARAGADLGMLRGNPWFGASIVRRLELALQFVATHSLEEDVLGYLYECIGAGVAVTETVPVCLALVKFAAGDPVRTIMLAANLGGDADTIASIAGGIAGAYAGIDAFPPEYLRRIEEVNHLDLESYAYRLTQFVVNHRS
jgi:ADP-ribosylglycohydrolase